VIWVKCEAEYFFKWDWTTQISLIRFNKLGFSETAIRGPDAAKTGAAPHPAPAFVTIVR